MINLDDLFIPGIVMELQHNSTVQPSYYVFENLAQTSEFLISQSSVIDEDTVSVCYYKNRRPISIPATMFMVLYDIESEEIVLLNEHPMVVNYDPNNKPSFVFALHTVPQLFTLQPSSMR